MASKRYLYSDTIDNFLQKDTDTIVGEITLSATQDINKETSNSWQQEVEILKDVLAPYAQKGSVYFEYNIPRMGRRADVIVLVDGIVLSDPCQYWSQTLYPWLDLPRKLGSTDHSWQCYQELHSKLIAIEERLAHDFFSCELLTTLRQAELLGKWGEPPSAPHYKRAWRHIFAVELYMLREEGEVPIPSCIEVVNSLRNAPDGIFEDWKQSETAALFENHGFKNQKRSGGYWF